MKTDSANILSSSMWGITRGLSVNTLIYPIEVIKIHQQCQVVSENSIKIAKDIFQKDGAGAFYKGLPPQLMKTIIKQAWVWPMITGIPGFFKRYNIGMIQQQALTGLSIATIDAAITTPLERAKILSAFTGKSKFSLEDIYNNGWRGFSINWTKLSIGWMTFLSTQEYLRDRCRKTPEQALQLHQLTVIGVQVAIVVSLVTAPFDIANTLKQAKDLSPTHLLSRVAMSKLYRGWPLSVLSLTIHNIASVIVIDKLGQKLSR